MSTHARKSIRHRLSISSLAVIGLGTVLVIFGLFQAGRIQAEFEVPIIGTGGPAVASMRGIFGYARSDFTPDAPGPEAGIAFGPREYYEAFAVGENLDVGATEQGVIYRYDGSQWQPVDPTIALSKKLHAVTGQYDFAGGYAPIWMVGDDGTILHNANQWSGLSEHESHYEISPTQNCVGVNTSFAQDLYALSAASGFRYPKLAGGQSELLLSYTGDVGNQSWRQLCGTGIPAGEHVAGIAYGPNAIAYLVTTSGGAELTRPCPGGSTGKLYKFNGTTVQLLATRVGTCFYGLDVARTTNSPITPPNGQLRNAIWVASSDGVFRFDEGTDSVGVVWTAGNRRAGTENKAWYSVSAVERRGGSGQNLLPNGDFEAWESTSPSGPTVNLSTWITTDEGTGRNNAGGTCDGPPADGRVDTNTLDIQVAPGQGFSGTHAIRIEPGLTYETVANCSTSTNPGISSTVGVFGRVDLSNVDGRRFRVSGQYKVEFTSPTPAGQYPEGGVTFRCDGSNISSTSDCSFTNRRTIRTVAQGGTATEPGNVGGYIPFDFIISNQHSQYNSPIPGNTAVPRLSRRNMILEVTCEATYGAKVWCDDLRVEVLDTPAASGYANVEVTAVGADGQIVTNPTALSATSFTAVLNQTQTVGQHLYALDMAEGQFAFAAGENSIFVIESPSNISGFIWVGAASPVTATTEAGLGWISSSCSNTRDASGNSLCQRFPNGYGLRLDLTQQTFSGRAWFGKSSLPSNSEQETLNLGQCLRNQQLDPGSGTSQAYDLTGMCNQATRRCYADRAHTADSTRSCIRDYDCFGRCERDEGFVCVEDGDCQRGLPAASIDLTGSPFSSTGASPQDRIQCDANLNSPGACTGAGWLSFNPTDFVGTPPPTVAGCASGGQVNADKRRLQGCGQFMTLADPDDPNNPSAGASTRGWVSLRGGNQAASNITLTSGCHPTLLRCYADWAKGCNVATAPVDCANISQIFGCKKCDTGTDPSDPNDLTCGFCQDQNGQSCSPNASSCHYFCDADITKPSCKSDADCTIVPGGTSVCKPVGRCSVGGAACANDSQCSPSNGVCSFGALCKAAAGNSCQQYGVDYDSTTGSLTGFAWSPDYGWLNFRNLQHGTTRFIRTQLGDIHSQGSIGGFTTRNAPANKCNATYLITAKGGISNFCSSFSTGVTSFENARVGIELPLTSPNNLFENAVGRLDLVGLETIVRDDGSGNFFNKYDMYVHPIANNAALNTNWIPAWASIPLEGSVYVLGQAAAPGNYQINQIAGANEVEIIDGAEVSDTNNRIISGNGLLLVNGNLRINENIKYTRSSRPVTDVRHIASLVVVVKGDLVIDAGVTDLAGFYFVTGKFCTASTQSSETDCSVLAITNALNRSPLTVRGLVFAQQFIFKRIFAGTVDEPRPSELFINDGRAQSNPLPGMTDFVSILPNTVSTSPSTGP